MNFVLWLLLSFIVLKLCGVIAWSWWVVLAPLWCWIGIAVVWVLYDSNALKTKKEKKEYKDKTVYRTTKENKDGTFVLKKDVTVYKEDEGEDKNKTGVR